MSDGEPVRLVLTPEQRELIHRVSGKHVEMIELSSDDDRADGGALRFLWRQSPASGTRQQWVRDDEDTSSPPA
jgi:hypothetical protein